jgi:dTDP-4-amino-4,6-dideoxygalactose transaminase
VSGEPIPQLDLRTQLAGLADALELAARRVLASGRFILGDELEAFESEFAAYCGATHAVGVASGTDALELALRATGVGPGDEVITVAHTFIATPLAISAAGATPVFVEVHEGDGLMDADAAAAAITSRTSAIVPVHLYGRCVPMAPLVALAKRHGLAIIEDAAQAHGALTDGERRAGTVGDAGAFSFYPTKNLGALGDAGAVVTSDARIAERLRLLRNYGKVVKYEHAIAGRNSRLDELQAAVLRVKLPHLDAFNAARRAIARRYREEISHPGVRLLAHDLDRDVLHQAVLYTQAREGLRDHLLDAGIATQIHYPIPCHRQAVYADRPYAPLPVTERLAAGVLSLPLFPELTDAQLDRVCAAVNAWRT